MRKAVMILLALAAIRLLPKALRSEARILELITLLFEVTLASGTGGPVLRNTSKTVNLESRAATLEVSTGTLKTNVATQTTRVNNLSGNSTSTNTLSDNQVSGISDDPAPTGGPVVLTSGVQGATVSGSTVAQHTHSYGHRHGRGSYAVGNGNHAHSLPNV